MPIADHHQVLAEPVVAHLRGETDVHAALLDSTSGCSGVAARSSRRSGAAVAAQETAELVEARVCPQVGESQVCSRTRRLTEGDQLQGEQRVAAAEEEILVGGADPQPSNSLHSRAQPRWSGSKRAGAALQRFFQAAQQGGAVQLAVRRQGKASTRTQACGRCQVGSWRSRACGLASAFPVQAQSSCLMPLRSRTSRAQSRMPGWRRKRCSSGEVEAIAVQLDLAIAAADEAQPALLVVASAVAGTVGTQEAAAIGQLDEAGAGARRIVPITLRQAGAEGDDLPGPVGLGDLLSVLVEQEHRGAGDGLADGDVVSRSSSVTTWQQVKVVFSVGP